MKDKAMAALDTRVRDPKGQFLPSVISASDEKGIGVTLTFRCAPVIARTISELAMEAVSKGTFPWKTRGDVMRWLIVAGLEHVAGHRDEDGPFRARQRLETASSNLLLAERDTRAIFANVCQAVRSLLTIDERERAIGILHDAVHDAHDLDDQVWGNWLVKELYKTFPELVSAPPPYASMTPPFDPLHPKARRIQFGKSLPTAAEEYGDPPGVQNYSIDKPKTRKKKKR